MRSTRHIFRAYDVRGIFNQEMTAGTAAEIGMAFGSYLGGEGRVFIGRDGRTSSEIMEEAFISGLASTGCECTSAGLIPIPTANFHIWQGDYKAGAYITASHNPPEYNGVRFRHGDGTGYTKENTAVRDLYLSGGFHLASWKGLQRIGRLDSREVVDSYLDFILKRFAIKHGLKVVLDLGNGVSALSVPRAFEALGAEVKTINEAIDGTFPGRPSEPRDETLGELKKAVRAEGADMGAGFDGDADRVMFVDDMGRVVQTEKIGAVIARDILRKRKGQIIANVSCSMIVEREIERIGGEVLRVRVGDVFISEAIKKHRALFAMETSAHYFLPEFYPFDDPLLISLRLGEILSSSGRKLSEIMDEIPSYPMKTMDFQCADEIKFKVMDRIAESWRRKGYSLDLTDGAKAVFEDGWALLRPSNTTPLIRASVEGENPARVEELLRMVKSEFEEACRE